MKKLYVVVISCFLSFPIYAQEMDSLDILLMEQELKNERQEMLRKDPELANISTDPRKQLKSRKGELYLPESRDWAISFDALPLLNYVGELITNQKESQSILKSPSGFPLTLTWKRFTNEYKCTRGKIRLGFTSAIDKNIVVQDENVSNDPVYVEDIRKQRSTNIVFSIGTERRRGNTRLQGLYGVEALILSAGGSTTYTYGNAYNATNIMPTSTNFDLATSSGYASTGMNSRIVKIKQGKTFGIGARLFIGVEYFVVPKISIGGEYGWEFMYKNTKDGYITSEYWDANTNEIRTSEKGLGGKRIVGIDNDTSGGQLTVNFYF